MMDVKVSKDNTLADGLIKRISSMLDQIESKIVHKEEEMIDRGKRNKTLSEAKPAENISKNMQSFLESSQVLKEVLPSHKLQDHPYE